MPWRVSILANNTTGPINQFGVNVVGTQAEKVTLASLASLVPLCNNNNNNTNNNGNGNNNTATVHYEYINKNNQGPHLGLSFHTFTQIKCVSKQRTGAHFTNMD